MSRSCLEIPVLASCCQICQSQAGTPHQVREMMHGTRDEFLYRECADCGCLSLVNIPQAMERYYPRTYYSLTPRPPRLLRRLRDRIYLSPVSFLVNRPGRSDLDVIRNVRLTRNMRLLDVGCGAGNLIGDLRELGYDARGVDPFVPNDVMDRFGVRVERKELSEVTESYDVILFRHSLEHMPIHMLSEAAHHLAPDGTCVVCIPLLGWAWKSYAEHWAQLDAPRHFFLHSRKSFTLLAAKSGFTIDRVVYDSTEFQFWASDAYQRNIPLCEINEPSPAQRRHMRRLAKVLNAQQQGDTAQFYLKLSGAPTFHVPEAEPSATSSEGPR